MKASVVVFPGSNCDTDCWHVLNDVVRIKVKYVWHKDTDLGGADLVVLPGGFSYGDYLRCGAVARFSPVMNQVIQHVKAGKLAIGICNGFQILLEAGLLPGAMRRNASLSFICKPVELKVENNQTMFTNAYEPNQTIVIPVAHGEGNYYCDEETLVKLKENNQIVFTYNQNPNGSLADIAGITNEKGNVLGMMPHPERAVDELLGGAGGLKMFQSIVKAWREAYVVNA